MNDANSLFGFQYWLWALACAVIATVYYFVWPKPVNNLNSRPKWRHIILRYFHSLTWVLIMISFLVRMAFPAAQSLADMIALLGFLVYLVFLGTTVVDRRAPD